MLLLQDCPDIVNASPLVEPSRAKIDLEHLLQDLPKYKPWLSTHSWAEWEDCMGTTDKLLLSFTSGELQKLQSAARITPTQPPVSLDSETVALLTKETATPPKVK